MDYAFKQETGHGVIIKHDRDCGNSGVHV